jgi:putative membrane protein
MASMSPIAQFAALIAALMHVGFFYLESIAFARPTVWARFHIASQADADVIRPMALNQGFYNLFLGLGIVAGLVLIATGAESAGTAIVLFACSCMVLAGVVLLAMDRRLLSAAAMQALPPLAAIVLTILL